MCVCGSIYFVRYIHSLLSIFLEFSALKYSLLSVLILHFSLRNSPSSSDNTKTEQKMKNELVLKLALHDEKGKKKAMKIVCDLDGVESISMDMEDKKLTVTGDIDPIKMGVKLRKLCHTEMVTFGPAKMPDKKKEEPKKEPAKKPDEKEEPKKKELKKAGDEKKKYNELVLKLDIHDEKGKKKAMKIVCDFDGVESISMDMVDKKLTVTGDIDPTEMGVQLKKHCHMKMVKFGQAKKPDKKEEPKKGPAKKPDKKEPKKEELKKAGDEKKM